MDHRRATTGRSGTRLRRWVCQGRVTAPMVTITVYPQGRGSNGPRHRR
ncbi:hypothetical protein I553_1606 [Mycobacterium xenopi 4042]|uniref:Uncharacterized protein n=1 Tax=Mycobacterium xenopi 4042 TaxID=1299334 RepID=X8CDX9_MYCXE|nr:hypothetical protein I553_1606 [Mycobacterium xenopi 4042]